MFDSARIILPIFVLTFFVLPTHSQSRHVASQEDQEIQKLEEARALLKNGKNADAETLALEILAEVEAKQGENSLQVAEVLDVLVESIMSTGESKTQELQKFIGRATSIREHIFGLEHAELSKSLYNFARLYWMKGRNTEAKPLIERALAIAEKAYDPEDGEMGNIHFGYAWVLQQTGDLSKARIQYEQALRIKEKELGSDHLMVANIINNLGLVLKESGEPEKAKTCFERTLRIRKKLLGSEHREVALAMDNLASLLHDMGKYKDAKALYVRVLPILEREFGPDHPRTADCLNDIGYLLKDMGDFSSAIDYHEHALRIREEAFGKNHPAVAYSLNNLAVVFRNIGDNERARMLFERCLGICEKVFGPDHESVAVILNNLANVLSDMGNMEEAEKYSRRSFEIQEKIHGPDSVNLPPYLVNYASALTDLGDFRAAKPLLQRALSILEANYGSSHPNMALVLINLADLGYRTANYNEAIILLERAHKITTDSVGEDHPLISKILHSYSLSLWATGEPEKALENALQSENIVRSKLRLLTRSLTERQALAYASERTRKGLDISLSLAAESPEGMDGAGYKAWDAIIRSRALVFDEMAARNRIILEMGDPGIAELAESLVSARQQLANLVVRGLESGEAEDAYRIQLNNSKIRKERLERELAKVSDSFNKEIRQSKAGLAEVQTSLPHGFALVAFAKYYHLKPGTKEEDPSYLAFVLRKNIEDPLIIFLGRAEEIDPLIFDWGQEIARGTRIPGRSEKEAEAAYRVAGDALRRKVWDPIVPYLGDASRILLVPDGSLHAVNFAALPIGLEDYLIEKGPLLHYLSAERDLLSSEDRSARGAGLLALGDPSFDETSLFASLSPESQPKRGLLARIKSTFSFRGTHSGCEDFNKLNFKPLPATHKEIDEVSPIWKGSKDREGAVLKLTGAMANETEFKMAAPGKRILHLATHGFFLEKNCPSAIDPSDEQRGPGIADQGNLPPVTGENPLLLTGLALAGANHRDVAGPEEDDGILTAEEVATLNLAGVDLVVLSACDTGIGVIRAGEGVFGLRRAFRLAGAQTLITSLWPVEDEVSLQWMKELYKALFRKGLDVAESVYEASLVLLRKQRRGRESTHPFYWAGFIASGDWQ